MPRSPSGPEAAAEAMVLAMEALIGIGEQGDNNNYVTDWYGLDDAWCNMAISYAAHKSGNTEAVCFGGKFAYTVAHADAFKRRKQWVDGVSGIRRGDIVFFNWHDGGDTIDHIGLVTGTRLHDIYTIEGNVSNDCLRKTRHADTIIGYGRPKYGTGVTTPAPAPTPPKEEPSVPSKYSPPAFPTGLRPGSARPSARGLQAALKAAGYMAKSITPADNYGPNTEAGVAAFHRANPDLSDGGYDPIIGAKGWAELHREAYGGAAASKPTPTPAAPVTTPTFQEPVHDYKRVYYGGRLVNARTAVMLKRARSAMGMSGEFPLTQGSYNRGVSASAGTHDGGGVVDLNTSGLNVNATLRALRQAGFAAWYRTPSEGFAYHIHACAIGDREMAYGARSQVSSYFQGRNGLAGNGWDTAPASVGRPYPSWAAKYR